MKCNLCKEEIESFPKCPCCKEQIRFYDKDGKEIFICSDCYLEQIN